MHKHKGICVTGYTHFFSAGAPACCQFGERRRRAPGVWPLLPPPCAGFSLDSPHLPLPVFHALNPTPLSLRHPLPSLFPHSHRHSPAHPAFSRNTDDIKCADAPLYVPWPPSFSCSIALRVYFQPPHCTYTNEPQPLPTWPRSDYAAHIALWELDKRSKSPKIESLWYAGLVLQERSPNPQGDNTDETAALLCSPGLSSSSYLAPACFLCALRHWNRSGIQTMSS